MNWYKTLDIHTKINLKSITPLVVGYEFSSLIKILGFVELVNCLEQKLKIEGILTHEGKK
jgi:hypothetical protein